MQPNDDFEKLMNTEIEKLKAKLKMAKSKIMRDLRHEVRVNILYNAAFLMWSAFFFNWCLWVAPWNTLDLKIVNTLAFVAHSYWGIHSIDRLRFWFAEWKDLKRLEIKHKC